MAEDDSQKEVKEEAHSLAETEVAGEGTHDRIPFTGVSLSQMIKIIYLAATLSKQRYTRIFVRLAYD